MKIVTEKNQRGITLYLAVITLSAALATALFVAGSLTREYKISTGLANSLKAVYVADSVLEYTLYQVRTTTYTVSSASADITITLPNAATATLSCPASLGIVSCNPLSTGSLTSLFSDTSLTSLAGIAPTGSTFSVKGQLVSTAGSVAGCPSDPLAPPPNCVYLTASAGYGGTNRAMEIVYDNK